jgi:hypothetical protein
MAVALDALEVAVMERRLVHENSPVLNWCMANAVTTGAAGNCKLDKDRAVFRIEAPWRWQWLWACAPAIAALLTQST